MIKQWKLAIAVTAVIVGISCIGIAKTQATQAATMQTVVIPDAIEPIDNYGPAPEVVKQDVYEVIQINQDTDDGPAQDVIEETIAPETTTAAETKTAETEAVKEASKGKYLGTFKATAYCGCRKCNGKWTGQPTASGSGYTEGWTIAVDPKVIPLGTIVIINGHKYKAQDTGSAIKGNRIDIYYDSHKQAQKFGVQKVEVYKG